jgi:hypothetical protein
MGEHDRRDVKKQTSKKKKSLNWHQQSTTEPDETMLVALNLGVRYQVRRGDLL